MLPMAELEDKRPYPINLLIALLTVAYLAYAFLTSNNYGNLTVSLEHDFSNILYHNKDTTTLYLYYYDDGLEKPVIVYSLFIIVTSLLLLVSFLIRRTLSTFLLLCFYVFSFFLMAYPYYHLRMTGDYMFLTSLHFLFLTSYVNEYSLYYFIPYYAVLIGLTLYFIVSQLPLRQLRSSRSR
ncbi:hypothetical protein H70357_11920 [Paenibacillus sp. FSL H7-0357]|nr:hypothetical protein [Paenibacillus sp. FSL H7-0357]AIQ17283.1 hypothetical protein H70357_11920 [Paenibacillus sp. FSL H7-0357]